MVKPGRSFDLHRTTAWQGDRPVLEATCSFTADSGGDAYDLSGLPDVVPLPDALPETEPTDGSPMAVSGGVGRDGPVPSMSMVAVKQELVDLSGEVWQRLRHRFDGLTDAEYLWEPAPGSWTIRARPDGTWRADWPLPRPDPEPFTTLAWRLWHLIDCYGEDRAPRWLDVAPQGDPIGLDDPQGAPPPTATEARALLDRAHDRWEAHLALVSEESLGERVGPVGHGYADRTRAAYVLHMLDEFIHHGAEISLLRDLWRWQHPLGVDAHTERAMRGDATLVDDLGDIGGDAASELLRVAASYARWDLVTALVDVEVAIPSQGRTPLHLAAGAGELDLVKLLVERGADPAVKDPEYGAPAVEWARFLAQPAVVEWLEAHTRA